MKADCHTVLTGVPMNVFEKLVVPNSASVIPPVFSKETAVVVASIVGSQAAGEVFGKSKIKGGNRYEQCEARKVEFVYFPKKMKARVWWVMYGGYYDDDDSDDEEDKDDLLLC